LGGEFPYFSWILSNEAMGKRIIILLVLAGIGLPAFTQANFLVSCPSEIRMVGMMNHFYVSRQSYLIYNSNGSILKMMINMNELEPHNSSPQPGQEIEYNTNIEDSNSLVFEGIVPENLIRPTSDLKDTYTFTIVGTIKFRNISYPTQIVCSYGAKMIRNNSQVALNLNAEILKMDNPMFIPKIKEYIDNLKIEIIDGTVNMVQN
jgi:hypothetical protein